MLDVVDIYERLIYMTLDCSCCIAGQCVISVAVNHSAIKKVAYSRLPSVGLRS